MVPGVFTKMALAVIEQERLRQMNPVSVGGEDCSEGHDDGERAGQLALAAACYATPPGERALFGTRGPDGATQLTPQWWPWEPAAWKPCPDDRVRELVKAGALIVAEIERLWRAQAAPEG